MRSGKYNPVGFFFTRERSQRPHRLRADTRGDTRAFLKKCFALGAGHAAHTDLRVDSLTKQNGEVEMSPFFVGNMLTKRNVPPMFGEKFWRALRGCEGAAVRIRRRSQFSARSKVIASVLDNV